MLAVSTCGLYAYRYVRLTYLISIFIATRNNEYFNMDEVVVIEYWSVVTTALWCSQNMIRLVDIGSFNSHIRVFYYTILYAMDYIVICIVLSSIFLVSFSTTFHFIIGQENHLFHSIWAAYFQVFAIPFAGKPTMEFQYAEKTSYIPYFIFSFYGYTYRFLIVNMFAVVLVNSYHRGRIRTRLEVFRYTILDYLKERIFRRLNKFDLDRMVLINTRPKDVDLCYVEPEGVVEIIEEEQAGVRWDVNEEESSVISEESKKPVGL